MRARIERIFARHYAERDGGIGDVARDGAGVVEQPVERCDSGDADEPARGKDADDSDGGRGHADGVAGVGAVAEHGRSSR